MPENKNDKNIFLETLEWICRKLETSDIPYMITGGSAVGFWGYIRTTMDIDIIIQIQSKKVEQFLKGLENEAYINIDEAEKSIRDKKMFNIILNKSCFKIDIIPLNEKDEYEKEKFKNKVKINFQSKEIFIISPEDLIISKLIWNRLSGGSERQLKDCESIYKLNSENLNLDYITKWVKILKLEETFNKIV
ncbi:MAG: DUF6036 family nucleotidyltransferase [Armatimonadota bacterium]